MLNIAFEFKKIKKRASKIKKRFKINEAQFWDLILYENIHIIDKEAWSI
jgi:predicted nucleic acid-binding protein